LRILANICVAASLLTPLLADAQAPVVPTADQLALLKSPNATLAHNKRLVFDYFREVLDAGHADLVKKYLSATFLQHDPNMTNSRDEFAALVRARRPEPLPIQATLRQPLVAIVAERDLVVMVFLKSAEVPGHPEQHYTTTTAEIYRIANHQIVEHWDHQLHN
jgi:predicted SnoaL-like aldol condensation-catalyzing enzyme